MMTINVNRERCIFSDFIDRTYTITTDQGHRYEGGPFYYDQSDLGNFLFYKGQRFDLGEIDYIPYIKRSGATTSDPMISLTFGVNIPGSNEKVIYEWNAKPGGYIMPEEAIKK